MKSEKHGVCDAGLFDRNDRSNRSASLDGNDSKQEPYNLRASNPIAPIAPIAPILSTENRRNQKKDRPMVG